MKTVAQLIEELKQQDPNTEVTSLGPDCGGYDCEWGSPKVFKLDKSGKIYVGHVSEQFDVAAKVKKNN